MSLKHATCRGLVNSRTRQLAYQVLDKSRTGQLADAIGDFACLVFLFGSICETATCPVCELTSARVVQSARCPVRELAIRKLAYPRVVQLPNWALLQHWTNLRIYRLIYFAVFLLLYFYQFCIWHIIAHNAMPKKISTKCNVFPQLIGLILRPHLHFTHHVRKKKNQQNHPHFTRFENPQVRRSANRILPEAVFVTHYPCLPFCLTSRLCLHVRNPTYNSTHSSSGSPIPPQL